MLLLDVADRLFVTAVVYRNFVKALPWLTVVREKVTDPAYSAWFLSFSQAVQVSSQALCLCCWCLGRL